VVEALDVAAGVSFLIAGVAAWTLSRRSAVLLVAAGLAWFLGGLVDPLVLAHRPLMLHAALAYPTGRLPGRFAVVIVIIAWLLALVPALGTSSVAMLILAALVAALCTVPALRNCLQRLVFGHQVNPRTASASDRSCGTAGHAAAADRGPTQHGYRRLLRMHS
jgi:hypothetical protein